MSFLELKKILSNPCLCLLAKYLTFLKRFKFRREATITDYFFRSLDRFYRLVILGSTCLHQLLQFFMSSRGQRNLQNMYILILSGSKELIETKRSFVIDETGILLTLKLPYNPHPGVYITHPGVYISFEKHFFAPPPIFQSFFSPRSPRA